MHCHLACCRRSQLANETAMIRLWVHPVQGSVTDTNVNSRICRRPSTDLSRVKVQQNTKMFTCLCKKTIKHHMEKGNYGTPVTETQDSMTRSPTTGTLVTIYVHNPACLLTCKDQQPIAYHGSIGERWRVVGRWTNSQSPSKNIF